MAVITNSDSQELKQGIVYIHKMMELRKLHMIRKETGKMCANCISFCKDKGMQRQTHEFIDKYKS